MDATAEQVKTRPVGVCVHIRCISQPMLNGMQCILELIIARDWHQVSYEG